MFTTKKTKTQTKQQHIDQNPIEAITHIGSGVANSFGADLLKGGANDFWKQVLGETASDKNPNAKRGVLQEGQELSLSEMDQYQEHKANPDIAPGIDYRREILYGSEQISRREGQVLARQIESIVIELKGLAAASQELEIQFKDVVVEQRITKPGKYHQSFFTWVITMIQSARARIEDAGAWLSAMHSKKGKKQQQNYWQMFKKHGTTFGLSNERVVATQTG